MIDTKIKRFAAAMAELPAQALHGDAHSGNALLTANGVVWNDFEDAWRGPVEWDHAAAAEGKLAVPPPERTEAFALCEELRRLHSALWAQVLRPGAYAAAAREVLLS